jgi:hypothetical protein
LSCFRLKGSCNRGKNCWRRVRKKRSLKRELPDLVNFQSFTVFYVIAVAGMHYELNTLIAICIAIIINFFAYERVMFKRKALRGAM